MENQKFNIYYPPARRTFYFSFLWIFLGVLLIFSLEDLSLADSPLSQNGAETFQTQVQAYAKSQGLYVDDMWEDDLNQNAKSDWIAVLCPKSANETNRQGSLKYLVFEDTGTWHQAEFLLEGNPEHCHLLEKQKSAFQEHKGMIVYKQVSAEKEEKTSLAIRQGKLVILKKETTSLISLLDRKTDQELLSSSQIVDWENLKTIKEKLWASGRKEKTINSWFPLFSSQVEPVAILKTFPKDFIKPPFTSAFLQMQDVNSTDSATLVGQQLLAAEPNKKFWELDALDESSNEKEQYWFKPSGIKMKRLSFLEHTEEHEKLERLQKFLFQVEWAEKTMVTSALFSWNFCQDIQISQAEEVSWKCQKAMIRITPSKKEKIPWKVEWLSPGFSGKTLPQVIENKGKLQIFLESSYLNEKSIYFFPDPKGQSPTIWYDAKTFSEDTPSEGLFTVTGNKNPLIQMTFSLCHNQACTQKSSFSTGGEGALLNMVILEKRYFSPEHEQTFQSLP